MDTLIKTLIKLGVKPSVISGKSILTKNEGVYRVLVGATISSTRKSFHYTYTNIAFSEQHWNPTTKTLYVKVANPGSFTGRNGCNIKELQRIWRMSGCNIELIQ